MSLTVAVDFDGVLADKDMNPIDGAKDMVTRLVRADFHVYVHSCRAAWGGGRAQIEAWLEANDFPDLDVVPKPRADVYLDDRAIRFDDWPSAYTRIIREEGRQS